MQNILLPHNIPVFHKVMQNLRRSESVLLETATGTGKSYIGAACIREIGGNWLIFVPTSVLKDIWTKLGQRYQLSITVITYQGYLFASTESRENLLKGHQGVILDEAHHVGADGWSQVVRDVKASGKPYLGLTAGSRRFVDGQDVADTYFDAKVNGYTLGQAIDQKILPSFHYISALFSFPDFDSCEIGCIKQSAYTKLKTRLEFLIENQNSIHMILQKHLGNDCHKIIIFVECIDDIPKAEECLKGIVKKEDIFRVNYSLSNEENSENIRQFSNCKQNTAIINVSMLMEGIHMPDIDTLIMLRRTESPRVFFQQLGRIASPENAEKKLMVFDFVGNSVSVKYHEVNTCDAIRKINEEISDKSNQIILTDYSQEALDIINEIEALLGLGWAEVEDDILRQYYPNEGMDVSSRLPGRSRAACKTRARILGVKAPETSWTVEEDEILKKFYPKEGMSVAKRLPERSKESCKARSLKLGLKSERQWSDNEIDILKTYYPIEGPRVCERLPGRKPNSCTTKANKLGLVNESRQWTDEYILILKEKYPKVGKDIVEYLPFSLSACRSKAASLGIKKSLPWTKEQIEILKRCYASRGAKKCAELTGHSVSSCHGKASSLGIKGK